MKVINIDNVEEKHLQESLFTGEVTRKSPVKDHQGSDLSIDYVHYPKGIRNKLHTHANDQVLIIINGHGIVATKEEKYSVKEGDVIHIPAGEEHWHGATKDSDFTHISITHAHTELKQIEE